jgi:tetratricopeptide (TPR) repeat protein
VNDPARYRRLRDLLHAAAERPAPERRAWLAERAAGDDSLVREVLALLDDPGVETRSVAPPLAADPDALSLGPGSSLGRFRVRSEIGRGGMGVVYEAEDPASRAVVAVKAVLPRFLAVPSARERFLREARLGLSIEHENVVRTLALEEAVVGGARVHLLVMERVRGRTLRALLDEMGVVPEGLWREIALQAARGLAAVHDAGAVHRDVKPENVLLTDDRRVRVMDLGIAKPSLASSLTVEGQFLGSVRYASPEQATGTEVGPASDVYSLGVVLYELATGRRPFEGDDPVSLLRAHAETPPVRAAERNPALSDFASEVVDACLEKRAADRFETAHGLVRVLEEAEAGPWWTSRRRAGARRPRGPGPRPPERLRLVARDEERAALRDAWASARRAEGRVALVLGEPGIGKTRLVEDLVSSVADERATVLRTDLAAAEDAGGVAAALAAALGSDLEADVAARLSVPPAIAAELAAFLRRRDPAAETRALGVASAEGLLVRLLRSLAREAPVLWVVEDAHVAGGDSRRLLSALARGVAGSAVLLVVTSRPGADPALLSTLGLVPGAVRLDLGRLAEDEVGLLAGAALGDAGLGAHLGASLARRADGVPLFVLEILRDLERRGRIVRAADGTVREANADDDTGAPRALADLLRARLAGLSAEERQVLEAAAVVGYEFDPGLVAAARGVPRLSALDVLGRLERRDGLVRSGPVLVRFDHRLLQEVLHEDLSPALRAELHARVADAIESSPAEADAGARAWRVAHHRLQGPAPERALPLVFDAIAYADRTFRKGDAYALARRALRAAEGDPATWSELVSRAVRLSVATGRAAETAPLLAHAIARAEAAGDGALVARLRFRRAEEGLVLGRFDQALADATAAHDAWRGESRLARNAVDALCLRGQALWCLGRLAESSEVQGEALAAARALGIPRLVSQASSDLGIALHEMGRLEEAEALLRESLAINRAIDDRVNLGVVVSNLGNVLFDAGRRAEALEHYESAIAIDRSLGSRVGEAVGWVNVGKARLSFGDLEGARAAFRRCEDLSHDATAPRVEAYALHGLAQVAWWSGDRAEARRRFEAALERRRSISHRPGVAETCLGLGTLAAEEGRADDARAFLREAAETAEAVSDPSVATLARLRLATLGDGSLEAARAAFDAAGPRLRHDARIEGRLLLWKATGDLALLAEARRFADEQRRNAPAAARAAMLERVPHLRDAALAPRPS